jgi:hypothetical protein
MNQNQVEKIFNEKMRTNNAGRVLDFKLIDWHYFYKAKELYIEFRNVSGQCYTRSYDQSELDSFFNSETEHKEILAEEIKDTLF